jgi:hypothetical protein
MDLFTALRTVLLDTNSVTAIVGAADAARIWNSWPRTYDVPCLVLDVDREDEQNDLSGHSGLTIAEVAITARGNTHDQSDALCNTVKPVLCGYAGGTFDAILDHVVHSETPKMDGSTGHWYDHVMGFTMLWNETD